MCGRYVLVQKVESIEKRFNVKAPIGYLWEPSFNISPGQLAPVITSDHPNHLDLLQFGMTPFWAKKSMYLINARAEGDRNKENNPQYSGSRDIINKPAYRKPIRSQRCLVLADAFIEGTTKEKLSNPFLVYLRNQERPFAFAGIFDEWINPINGNVVRSFSIITTTSNELMQKIPHHRMPVILEKRNEQRWLNKNTPLSDITRMLQPYSSQLMNAYPISSEVKNPQNNFKSLINPLGERIDLEVNLQQNEEIHLYGMGRYKES